MAALLKRLCDGCLVLYFVNIVNDSVLYDVNVNVSEKLLDVNDKKKKNNQHQSFLSQKCTSQAGIYIKR